MTHSAGPSPGSPPGTQGDNKQVEEAVAKPPGPEEDEYPPKSRVVATITCMMFTAFLVALDRTIIATAIPVITNHFNSLDDVGWYASAYLLTMSAFQLLMGRVYTFYNVKYVYIWCVCVFELGSLVCGAAPNSTALIVGRALAGLGAAGIMSGGITIIVYLVPLQKRPAWTGLFGSVFAIASVAGPLLGGVFTDKVSWRWCFYINIPVGGVAILILAFVLQLPPSYVKNKKKTPPLRQQIDQLDPIGTSVYMPAIVCLLLALQWGGTTYGWSDARIIALLVLAALLLAAFVFVQLWRQEQATIPPRIFRTSRSVAAAVWYATFSGANMMTMTYFLPIWFQAIKGASAVHSGIMNLPAILALTVASMAAGFTTRKIGYFTQWMYLSSVITPIGAGLISTFTTTTPHAQWIGYQVIWGFGLGLGMQQPALVAQTVLARHDVPTGVSLMFFGQTLGGAVFVSVANNVFDNGLADGLAKVPGIDPAVVAHVGATDLRTAVPRRYLPAVLVAYNHALRHAFYLCAALAAATVLGSLATQWLSLKAAAHQQQKAAAQAKVAAEAAAGSAEAESKEKTLDSAQTDEILQPRTRSDETGEKKVEEV